MSRASKGKSKEKSGETGISKVVRVAEKMQKEYKSFRDEWADKFNSLSNRFEKFIVAVGQQLAGVSANQQIHSNVLERLDINIQAVDRGVREAYGRFEMLDTLLQKSDLDFAELTAEELASIKESAQETYKDTMQECFRQVNEERKAAIEEQRAAAKKAAEEAKKASEEEAQKAEAEVVEQEMQKAEEPSTMLTEPGGEGSKIPEGAEVFGG